MGAYVQYVEQSGDALYPIPVRIGGASRRFRFTKAINDPADYCYEALAVWLLGDGKLTVDQAKKMVGIRVPDPLDGVTPSNKRMFTVEEMEIIRELYIVKKWKVAPLAREMGCGLSTMYNYLHDNDIMPRKEKKW